MGLQADGSPDPSSDFDSIPMLGAANDGDGDRNLIAGAQCFVTPSDSMAMICDNWEAIPHFAKAGGPKGVARSMHWMSWRKLEISLALALQLDGNSLET